MNPNTLFRCAVADLADRLTRPPPTGDCAEYELVRLSWLLRLLLVDRPCLVQQVADANPSLPTPVFVLYDMPRFGEGEEPVFVWPGPLHAPPGVRRELSRIGFLAWRPFPGAMVESYGADPTVTRPTVRHLISYLAANKGGVHLDPEPARNEDERRHRGVYQAVDRNVVVHGFPYSMRLLVELAQVTHNALVPLTRP